MAPKKAKTAPKAEEPAAKKAKVEEPKKEAPKKEEAKKEEPKKEEPKKEDAMEVEKAEVPPEPAEEPEKEKDDKPDSRPSLKESIGFEPNDMTLNVVPTMGGKVLMTLSEGGMQYFIAGARANVGMKAGRYLFEAKVVQTLNTHEGQAQGRGPKPKHMIRVGFSTSKSSLILGDSEDSVCFDGEGQYIEGKSKMGTMKKMKPGVTAKFGKGVTVAVLLNLDEKSDNANTVSLFKDGVRVSDPKPLPDSLKGKALYPHVSYRNVSVQVNFGPTATTKLPFTCRSIQAAAVKDIAKVKSSAPEDGKFEVMVPVAFPDEGTFEWADSYLEKNPKFVELSDRKILEWAKKSGIWKAQGGGQWGGKSSNDKPVCSSGLPMMDDYSVRKVINAVAPVVPRNYLVMEVRANLLAEERKQVLRRFNYPCYKKVANVVMGEPTEPFKERVQAKILADKQAKYDQKWRAQKAAEKKKKAEEKRKKDAEKARKKAEKARKKAAEERKKKLEEAKQKALEEKKKKEEEKKEGEEKKEEKAEDKKEAEKKEEEKKEEGKKEEEKKEEDDSEDEEDEPMPEEPEGEPEKQELTEEEKKVWFVPKGPTTDLTVNVLNSSFSKFTTPEKDEGFDDIRYEWQPEKKAKDYLKTWVLEKKLTSRIDDLQPGAASKERLASFKKLLQEWQDKQKAFKAAPKKKVVKKTDDDDEDKDVDIYTVANICDIGDGVPLFEKFDKEDWILMQTRFEFHHLVRSFKEDTQDADRLGIHEDHINFYYNKYFGKSLNPKPYGVDDFAGLVTMIKDTVSLDSAKKVMSSPLEDNLEGVDIFVKLTEECRRERQRRLDAGDETARLKFAESLKMSFDKKGPAASPAKAAGPKGTPAPKKK